MPGEVHRILSEISTVYPSVSTLQRVTRSMHAELEARNRTQNSFRKRRHRLCLGELVRNATGTGSGIVEAAEQVCSPDRRNAAACSGRSVPVRPFRRSMRCGERFRSAANGVT